MQKGRAKLCKASKAGICKGEMESLAKQARGDVGRWQTACSVEGKHSKYPDMSWCVSMQLDDSLPTYQYHIEMSAEY